MISWANLKSGRTLLYLFLTVAVIAALYFLSQLNYALFHTLAEGFSIVIAFAIFFIAWNTRQINGNGFLLFLGVAYLFVGILDFMHTLSYQGMGVFQLNTPNVATQFWVAARYMESLSILAATLLVSRKFNEKLAFFSYALATILVILSIFYWKIFPAAYVMGSGLTPFKIISEYIISAILAFTIWRMYKARDSFDPGVFRLVVFSLVLTIASEMAFTLYTDVFGFYNIIGHLLKIASFYLIYKALIENGLNHPYQLLFRNLKQSEEKYQNLFDTMTEGFAYHEIILDPTGKPCDYRFIEANHAFEELTGLGDVAGKTVLECIPDLEPFWVEIYGRVALEGEPAHFESFSAPLDRWYDVHAYSPEKGFFVALFVDITERKRVEQMKDEFISLVSHELRTPLTIIRGSLLSALSQNIDQDDRISLVRNAVGGADSLYDILENMIELSRYQSGRISPRLENIKIDFVIEKVVRTLEDHEATQRFEVDVPPDFPELRTDAAKTERILYNLMENAAKYSPPESVIRVNARREDDFAVVEVTDEGPGIADTDMDKIFKLFERINSGKGGLGIGLVVCQRLAEALSGRVEVDSEPGKGSTFSLRLPLARIDA